MQAQSLNRGIPLAPLLFLTILLILPVSPEEVRAQSGIATSPLPWSPISFLHSAAQAAESARNDPRDTLWTNDRWQPGFGRSGTDGEVIAVAHDGTDIFIGGDFEKVEGRRFNGIAHWDGKNWHTLGEGLNAGVNGNGVVYAIAIDGNNVYVGGQFRAIGGIEARNIARFDRRSRTWHTVGQGIGGIPQSAVLSLLMYRGELVAGGRFVVAGSTVAVNIARWNGVKWRRVGRGANDMVRALATDDSLLYAGGDFTIAGAGISGKVAAYDITTDRWSDLGTGIHLPYHSVAALAVDGDNVCIGGRFDSVDGDEALNFAILDRGTGEWGSPGDLAVRKYLGGAGLLSPDNFGSIPIRSLLLRDQQLYIGGTFDSVESVLNAAVFVRYSLDADTFSVFARVSAYTGESYESSGVVGIGGALGATRVLSLASGNGDTLYIGGSFSIAGPKGRADQEPETVIVGNLCSLSGNDTVWRAVGNAGPDGPINAMVRQGNDLYILGKFKRVGPSMPVNGICRLDMEASRWHSLGTGFSEPITVALNPIPIGKRAVWFQGRLIVAGDFNRVDGLRTGPIAAWDTGTESWSTIGGENFGVVEGLVADSTHLYVVHEIRRSGSKSLLSVWDGSSWQHSSDTFSGLARAVEVYDSSVYIGGDFRQVGDVDAPYLARWNMRTDEWGPLGYNPDGPVHALQMIDSLLYVGGSFTLVDSMFSQSAATWDPASEAWGRIRTGINGNAGSTVKAFHKARYGVYVGGEFTTYIHGHASNYCRAVMMWNGSFGRTLGTGVGQDDDRQSINAFASTDSTLIVGGSFLYAGIYGVSNLATWAFPDSVYIEDEAHRDDDILRSLVEGTRITGTSSAARSRPEDVHWDDRFSPENHPAGPDDEVFAIAPDNQGGLYVAGAFRRVVGIEAGGIAYWNGSDWEALDNGVGNGVDGIIFGLKVVDDKVYVGGQFSEAGGVAARNIAVWDRVSRTWSPLGEGIEGRSSSVPFVSDIEFRGGRLYAAGSFTHAGGRPAQSIAFWDGGEWHPLTSGIEGVVTALEFFGDDLFIGGNFGVAGGNQTENIALWDGTGWKALSFGMSESVNQLRSTPEGMLAALNIETHLARILKSDSTPSGYVRGEDILWDFWWDQVEFSSNGGEVRDVVTEGPILHFGGRFAFNPPQSGNGSLSQRVSNIALRYGSEENVFWSNLNGGINGTVNALALSGNKLYAAGLFSNPGEARADNIAVWDNLFRVWRPLLGAYQLGPISALTLHRGEVLAGGPFRYRENPLQVYDDDNHLARLNATGWDLVDGRVRGRILAVTSVEDEIIATGQFLSAALNITVNVARWNSELEEWTALTPGSGVADQEDISWVSALAADAQNIYVGGLFSVVDTFETPHIARFDRQEETWHPLGEGLDKEVMTVAIGPDGALYAGGRFQHSGTTPMRGIARWNGEEWEPLGEGIEGDVVTIAFGDGKVYAGGLFDRAGNVDATNVAAWDRATGKWEALGAGLTSNVLPVVERLLWQDGTLFAAGFFAVSGTDSVRNIARFRNGGWEPLGSGIDFAAFDMIADRGDIYVSGSFHHAGGKPSPWIALWHDPTLSVEEAPRQFAGSLLGTPNPTAGDLIVRYSLLSPTRGRIVVTDATGRDVAEVYSGTMGPGEGAVLWHPHETVSPGIYFCRLETREGVVVEKVILLE